MTNFRTSVVFALVLSTPAVSSFGAKAPGAPAPACGDRAVPLAVGNSWTYRSGPEQLVVKITDVQPGKDWQGKPATMISAEETLGARVTKTSYTCNAAGIFFPPDSFYFSGEPGGGVGDTFTVTERGEKSLPPDAALIVDANWIETLKADVARSDSSGVGAVHQPAKMEAELHVQVHPSGGVATPTGNYPRALKLSFELRGRGIIGDAKVEIPIKRPGAFYIQPGIGIVKVEDVFDKNWELTETNIPAK